MVEDSRDGGLSGPLIVTNLDDYDASFRVVFSVIPPSLQTNGMHTSQTPLVMMPRNKLGDVGDQDDHLSRRGD